MKTKAIVAIMVTMLLVTLGSCVFPVRAYPTIKIGVIGPSGWPQMQGMQEGATLAAEWINGPGGGIVIGGTRYDVSLHSGDEHAADMRPDLGAAEMERLITVEGIDFAVGGFRTEVTGPIREVAVKYNKLFFICGAATNALIDCGYGTPGGPTTPCGKCVRDDYTKYKYMFRVTPINDTMLARNIIGFLAGYVLPSKLAPLYGSPVNTAVIAEDLDWTVTMYNMFTLGAGTYLPGANVVYSRRTPWDATNFATELDAMHAAGVRLIIHIFSAPASIAFISQLAAHPIKAVAAGIDVLGQSTDFWGYTGGKCQYEGFLASTGTRTLMNALSAPYNTTAFWDKYYARFNHAPIYTSWGVYDAIIAMRETLQSAGIQPPLDKTKTDALIPIIEQTNRQGTLGKFKYTTFHDVFSNEYGATWTQRYVRAAWVQWQAGRLEVVWPLDQAFSKKWALPSTSGEMYPYPTDVTQEGTIDTADISAVGYAFGSKPELPSIPAHPRWQFVADVDRNKVIDGADHTPVCYDFGRTVELPLPYCSEAGRLH